MRSSVCRASMRSYGAGVWLSLQFWVSNTPCRPHYPRGQLGASRMWVNISMHGGFSYLGSAIAAYRFGRQRREALGARPYRGSCRCSGPRSRGAIIFRDAGFSMNHCQPAAGSVFVVAVRAWGSLRIYRVRVGSPPASRAHGTGLGGVSDAWCRSRAPCLAPLITSGLGAGI